MTTQAVPITKTKKDGFKTSSVLTIMGGHFIHDVYTAFVAPLLPLIIEKLSLNLTQAGSLTAFLQFPAILNPFIGYLADKVSLRYFVILAPGITASLISILGLAQNYMILAIILFTTGISVAAFHAPAPAIISRLSGGQIGKGMSIFMAGGEMGRTLGPLLIVWVVSTWTLEEAYPIMLIGWAASLVLFLRLRKISAKSETPGKLRAIYPTLRTLFLPLLVITFFRMFQAASLTTYLPTFLNLEGANLWVAGASLSILELAGVGGALLSGTLSDRLGRIPVLLVMAASSFVVMLLFLNVEGFLQIPVLLALGFTALSPQPVYLALVQDHVPNNRAVGNGLYMSMNFLVRSLVVVLIGIAGDTFGLRNAFLGSAFLSLLTIPGILSLPNDQRENI
jgi:FSR family fosmidomycin resistance protein-like MFS transporter